MSDHLKPVGGVFSFADWQMNYYLRIREILLAGLHSNFEIQVLILSSLDVEEVVALERRQGNYYIVHHKMEQSLWHASKEVGQLTVTKRRAELLLADVELYKNLFLAAMKTCRYPDQEPIVLDGVNYYFSVMGRGAKSGKVWSPPTGSKMHRLVELAYALIELVNGQEKVDRVELSATSRLAIVQLTDELGDMNNK